MIKVHELKKTFSVPTINPFKPSIRVEALNGISFEVGSGEIVALVGRNGAGKSTLLKILGMVLLADSGTARICDMDISSGPASIKRKLGIVNGDERSMYWRITGRQNLSLFGVLYDVPRSELSDRVDEVIHDMGLKDYADRPVRSYSSGMKQRLTLARGLLHKPEVVLMDEPTRSADPALQARFTTLVRDEIAGKRGCAVLFATHNMEEAVALGGTVAVIEKGKIVYSGRPESPKTLKRMIAEFDGEERGPVN